MPYDLVVIGGGPAGEKAAVAAAYFGKKVALVEREPAGPGGSTVHTGTLPSKTLRETALYLTGFKKQGLYEGLAVAIPEQNRSARALMCRLPQIAGTQAEQIRANLERHGVDLVQGAASFLDASRVAVGERILEASNFYVATGSSPRQPAPFDFSDPEIFDSDEILALDRLPTSLAVIGGGVIGSEYACVFNAFGVKVEIVERGPRLLSFLDLDISNALMDSMRDEGIGLHLNDGVKDLCRNGEDFTLELESGNRLVVDKALISAGRIGNTRGLGLEKAGVAVDERGLIQVDPSFRTSASHIYAGGDVIGRPGLTSTAMEQGRLAVSAMFDIPTPARDFEHVPFGIYTIPEACSCGPTQQELEQRGVPIVVGKAYMRHNARGQIMGDTDGFVKLVFHAETRVLLGTHIIAERATELIHIGQAVMHLGGTVDYFIETVMSYPSLTVAYKFAAYEHSDNSRAISSALCLSTERSCALGGEAPLPPPFCFHFFPDPVDLVSVRPTIPQNDSHREDESKED